MAPYEASTQSPPRVLAGWNVDPTLALPILQEQQSGGATTELHVPGRTGQVSWHLDRLENAPSSEGVIELAAALDSVLDGGGGQDYTLPGEVRELLRSVGYDEPLASGRIRPTNDPRQLLLRIRLREDVGEMTMLYMQAFRAPGAGGNYELGSTILSVDYEQDFQGGPLNPKRGMALRLAQR